VGDGIIDGYNTLLYRLPEMMDDAIHAGCVALVTGAGRGIGAATARLLAGEGAAVALAARTEEEIFSVAGQSTSRGGTAIPVSLDVADEVSSCFEFSTRPY
jgi:NADP-dependent 3-hydroxy acid dehydrogenase YdfG